MKSENDGMSVVKHFYFNHALALYFIMLKNGQKYFKNLAV